MHLFSLCFYVFILSVRVAAFQSASLLDPISVLTKGADTGCLNRHGLNFPGKIFAAFLLSFSFDLQSTTFLMPQKCTHWVQHAKTCIVGFPYEPQSPGETLDSSVHKLTYIMCFCLLDALVIKCNSIFFFQWPFSF